MISMLKMLFIGDLSVVLFLIQMLLATIANVNAAKTSNGVTQVYQAAWYGHSQGVKVRVYNRAKDRTAFQSGSSVLTCSGL